MGLDSVAFQRDRFAICFEMCTNEHGIQSEIAKLRLWDGPVKTTARPGLRRTFQRAYTSQSNRDDIRES